MRNEETNGWVVDAQLGHDGISMEVWLFAKDAGMQRLSIPWQATIHVYGTPLHLRNLAKWLDCPEISYEFSVGKTRFIRRRLSLDQYEVHEVLEIDMTDNRAIRRLANHIESRGDFHRYTLYSVDAHLAQRFFVQHRIAPFDYVNWNGSQFRVLDSQQTWPDLSQITMEFDYTSVDGFDTIDSHLSRVRLKVNSSIGDETWVEKIDINHGASTSVFLSRLQSEINRLDPDIIITKGGDFLHFAMLKKLAETSNPTFTLSRTGAKLQPRTMSRIVHSYGQVIRKDSYFPIHGRLHIDLQASFIVREGGIHGLFELSCHSRQSPQDISRLSPGSVISAIQMRTAMEDGVLVPWKKNRPEDTKTAWELMMADRGGLYLDSKPGIYQDVIELDFASLFPNIIATRNISPETLNCACCQPTEQDIESHHFLSSDVESTAQEFRRRRAKEHIGTGLFPVTSSWALPVPGLSSYTCGRIHGFLGRVVAPIIERRRQLKQRISSKGDLADKQQNALKWLLVTCFGYTGYKNARFGRIEAHEAICAWAREILLQTISIAENEGWKVLHAIVDCVWIYREDVTRAEKRVMANHFAEIVSQKVGIPLEFEDLYHFIAFLPSRIHGSGSLTKYWAYGEKGTKLRGIEARQHSTPKWIGDLQCAALNILIDHHGQGFEINDSRIQQRIIALLHDELQRLNNNIVSLEDLVNTRRVSKTVTEFSVSTLTHSALLRAQNLGYQIMPGRKVRFVVVNSNSGKVEDRVVLIEELSNLPLHVKSDYDYYSRLAVRAIWAILSPFGWSDDEIRSGSKITTLFDFNKQS